MAGIIKVSNTMVSIIENQDHLESHMLDHKDKADHEASNATHPSHESEDCIDVHAAW